MGLTTKTSDSWHQAHASFTSEVQMLQRAENHRKRTVLEVAVLLSFGQNNETLPSSGLNLNLSGRFFVQAESAFLLWLSLCSANVTNSAVFNCYDHFDPAEVIKAEVFTPKSSTSKRSARCTPTRKKNHRDFL